MNALESGGLISNVCDIFHTHAHTCTHTHPNTRVSLNLFELPTITISHVDPTITISHVDHKGRMWCRLHFVQVSPVTKQLVKTNETGLNKRPHS